MNQIIEQSQRITAFLHFFDVHFLELKRVQFCENEVAREAKIATRMALLFADEILIPAASFFEARLCRQIVLDLRSLFNHGVIWLVGNAANIEEFTFKGTSKNPSYTSFKSCIGCWWSLVHLPVRNTNAGKVVAGFQIRSCARFSLTLSLSFSRFHPRAAISIPNRSML